jgi:hypothetical protein
VQLDLTFQLAQQGSFHHRAAGDDGPVTLANAQNLRQKAD